MFFGYCLNPVDQSWTPPVSLPTARDCYHYCALHHHWTPEVRITDEGDFLVLHVEDHILKCPMPDGTLEEHDLRERPR
jgi:hypothetical protein